MKKTVVSFGEILWDILPTCKVIGGAPFNFAFRVNSLGDRGLIISRLGRDKLGRKAFDSVSALGLDTTYLQWDTAYPTGTVQVSFDRENRPDYLIVPRVAYDQIEITDFLLDISSEADCICFGTLIQRADESRYTLRQLLERSNSSLKFCDVNLRKKCFSKDTVAFSLENSDAVKMNEEEAYQLAGLFSLSYSSIAELCEKMLSRWSLRYCLVTLAECGAFALSDKGENAYVPGYKVEMADSLGAGDAFAAGFIHMILNGASVAEACRLGNTLGALAAAKRGATATITRQEINKLDSTGVERNIRPEFVQFID